VTLLAGALQELIEGKLTAPIGAAAHERTTTRTNLRDGHRPRTLGVTPMSTQWQPPTEATASM
jgi:hypothetical protein